MALYRRSLTLPDVARLHILFNRAIKLAQENEVIFARAGQPGASVATERELLRAYADFSRGLDVIAKDTAKLATKAVQAELTATRRRPDTGHTPHLRNAIVSRPLRRFGTVATGEVGIGDIDVLDAVVNPYGPQYGPYWRAQEQGTTHQAGRVVYGGFYGSGGAPGPFKPDPAFRAPNKGPHAVFISTHAARGALSAAGFGGRGPGAKGGLGGGKMTISVELQPRRFIEKGTAVASAQWRADLAELERLTDKRLAAIVRPASGRRP